MQFFLQCTYPSSLIKVLYNIIPVHQVYLNHLKFSTPCQDRNFLTVPHYSPWKLKCNCRFLLENKLVACKLLLVTWPRINLSYMLQSLEKNVHNFPHTLQTSKLLFFCWRKQHYWLQLQSKHISGSSFACK